MTRPTFPDRALLSPKLFPTLSSGPSSPRSPLSPLSPRFRTNRSENEVNAGGPSAGDEVELPELCHSPRLQQDEVSEREEEHDLRETMQGHDQDRAPADDEDAITASTCQKNNVSTSPGEGQDASQEAPYEQTGKYSTVSSTIEGNGLWPRFQRMWIGHVSIRVATSERRNHLALERSFLGYLRTSLALSFTGVMIAQLFRLEQPKESTPAHAVRGEALAAAFICGSIVTALTGAIRFWRQQIAMAAGKCWAGGPELLFIWGVFVALVISMFVVMLIQPALET